VVVLAPVLPAASTTLPTARVSSVRPRPRSSLHSPLQALRALSQSPLRKSSGQSKRSSLVFECAGLVLRSYAWALSACLPVLIFVRGLRSVKVCQSAKVVLLHDVLCCWSDIVNLGGLDSTDREREREREGEREREKAGGPRLFAA